MQKLASRLLMAALIVPFTVQAAEKYTIDPSHTYVLYHINHLGFSTQVGKFTDVTGKITLDQTKPQNSSVSATIGMKNINSGVAKLDEHLKGADFFDIAQYPKATFVSDKIVVTGKDTGKIYGTLTLRGISKEVVLDAKMMKIGMFPMKNKKTIGFVASTEVKRSDFGMKSYLPMLGDNVQLDIGLEANLGG